MIRKARKEDFAQIMDLNIRVPFPYCNFPEYINKWVEDLIEKAIVIVYESEGKIIGCVAGEKLILNACMAWFLSIKHEFQDGLIGPTLYFELEKECRKQGIKWLMLDRFQSTESIFPGHPHQTNSVKILLTGVI